jgi:tetratricopeptide (TPR) repeat protein
MGTLTALEAAVEAAPANFDVKLELAREYGDQNRSDEALRLVDSVLAADPGRGAAWLRLGQLHRARGDLQKSMEAFKKAIETQPNHTQALVELARETWSLGQPKFARAALQRALSQDPTDLGAIIASTELSLLGGDPESAMQSVRCAIELHPGQIGPYLLGARAAAELLDRDEAERLLDQAGDACGFQPEIVAAQIHLLRQYRDYDAARVLIAETGERSNANFGYWMQTTSFAITQGEFDAAERALNSAPPASTEEIARVVFLRASLAEARRQYPEAVAGYEAAIALDGFEPQWREAAARCCLLLGDPDRTYDHLRAEMQLNAEIKLVRGESFKISQHHLGQMLDEFILDWQVLAKLKEICVLPAEARIDPLKQLVRDNSEGTAPAILLLIAMRQAGHLWKTLDDRVTEVTTGIPKRIVQYWHANVPPLDVQQYIASWRERHPDYEHVLFDDTTAHAWLRTRFPAATPEAFLRGRNPADRVNILRLAYLVSEGGFFVDADDRCIARLNTFVPPSADFVGYQESYGTIGVNFIGAAPGHPVIAPALDGAVTAVNRGDHDIAWLSTGPGLLTRAFAQSASKPNPGNWLKSAHVLELHELQRAVGVHCPARYK